MYGCPQEGMTYDTSVCGAAEMLGIPAGTAFVLEYFPYGDDDIYPVSACSANGFTTSQYREDSGLYDSVYRLLECIPTGN